MATRLTIGIVGLFIALAVYATGAIRPASAASTQPVRPYRLLYRAVAGSEPRESVFVIVSPDGYPSVTTFAKLHWMIEHAVIAPATLRWEPSDLKSTDPEPLDSPEAVKSLTAFCESHKIKFVRSPLNQRDAG